MSELMTDWVEVDDSKYNGVKDARNVIIEMNVSPYDVPQHVRGGIDERHHRFVIEFRYIDDEDTREVKVDKHVQALIGRKSGRVYSLLVDVDERGKDPTLLTIGQPEEVRKDASQALGSIYKVVSSKQSSTRSREKNYSVAEKVLGDYWSSIMRPLAAG